MPIDPQAQDATVVPLRSGSPAKQHAAVVHPHSIEWVEWTPTASAAQGLADANLRHARDMMGRVAAFFAGSCLAAADAEPVRLQIEALEASLKRLVERYDAA